jgi:hypothetical protein
MLKWLCNFIQTILKAIMIINYHFLSKENMGSTLFLVLEIKVNKFKKIEIWEDNGGNEGWRRSVSKIHLSWPEKNQWMRKKLKVGSIESKKDEMEASKR